MREKARIKSIELWRVYFILMMVLSHVKYLTPFYGENAILKSWHDVNFFFMLSGYLMAKHSEKPMTGTLGEDYWSFLLRKIRAFYPLYLLSIVFIFFIKLFTGVIQFSYKIIYYLWDILLLRVAGFPGQEKVTLVGPAWYLMAMILAMAVLYPLLRAKRDVFLHILAPLTAVFLYGWFSQVYGKMYWSMEYDNGICLGLLRGIAGISLGCFLYQICQKIKEKPFLYKNAIRIATTIIELSAVLLILIFSFCCRNGQIDFVCIFLQAVLLVSEFSGLSMINDFVQKWRTDWIAEYSLSLYLCHIAWIYVLNTWCSSWPRELIFAGFFVFSFLTAVLFVWILKGIRLLWTKVKQRINPVFPDE